MKKTHKKIRHARKAHQGGRQPVKATTNWAAASRNRDTSWLPFMGKTEDPIP